MLLASDFFFLKKKLLVVTVFVETNVITVLQLCYFSSEFSSY